MCSFVKNKGYTTVDTAETCSWQNRSVNLRTSQETESRQVVVWVQVVIFLQTHFVELQLILNILLTSYIEIVHQDGFLTTSSYHMHSIRQGEESVRSKASKWKTM